VDEVAPISINAEPLLEKSSAHFGFVFAIGLMVLFEFMEAVGELASLLVRAIPILDELLAEL
jgi:hypothetical protein